MQRDELLDGILLEVEDLRNKLADLLLDVPHNEDDHDNKVSQAVYLAWYLEHQLCYIILRLSLM